jgi:two-component system chemotaxis response regulator CheY
LKILIAEDQAPTALFLRRILERSGHEVTVATDGEAAWQQVQDGDAPLLISDWVMPGIDGPELCRRIRTMDRPGYLYVILLTSRDRHVDKLEGLRAGADDFLVKPPDPDELAVRLEVAERIIAVHERLARQHALLAELATIDELTGVRNRRQFREDLEMHTSMAIRTGLPLSLIMLDVDHFKQYNDSYGHRAGDELLQTLAALLRASVREHDLLARYGGEEFAIVLPSTGADPARLVAERLRATLAGHPWPLRPVTASFGVATATPRSLGAAATLVDQADQALYWSKRSGRNRASHYHDRNPDPTQPPSSDALPAWTSAI